MKDLLEVMIFSADTKPLIQQKSLSRLLELLPATLHIRAIRYKSEQSAYNYVTGRLLLQHGLDSFNLEHNLEDIKLLPNGKPVLPNIHFNISHSDSKVICAFCKSGHIGVDLEKIRTIDFDDFTSTFSPNEWKAIHSSANPIYTFYWFWTRKECIIKALGLSLSYLHQIELDVSSDKFDIDGETWFLRELNLGDGFVGMVCSEQKIVNLDFIKLSL